MYVFNFYYRNSTLPIEIQDYQNDGAYDVTISTLFAESELPSQTIFFCQIVIPDTPYNTTKRFVYNPGKLIYITLLYYSLFQYKYSGTSIGPRPRKSKVSSTYRGFDLKAKRFLFIFNIHNRNFFL